MIFIKKCKIYYHGVCLSIPRGNEVNVCEFYIKMLLSGKLAVTSLPLEGEDTQKKSTYFF